MIKMASVNLQLSEFGELCRICGSKTSLLLGLHIFEREGNLRQIYQKIKACLPIQVARSDKLPKMVCEECVYKLDALFEFRERSLKTEFVLHNMLKNVYIPVCNDTLTLSMEKLFSPSDHNTSLQEETITSQPAGAEVSLDNNSEQLDAIITIPLNHQSSNAIKCEPEILLKSDISQRGSVRPPTNGDPNRDPLSLESNHPQSCTLSSSLNDNLQIQEIRNLQNLTNETDKANGVQSTRGYIVTGAIAADDQDEASGNQQQPWFYCNICGKPFNTGSEFQTHCELHLEKCNECGMSFMNEETLIAHKKDEHHIESRDPLVEENCSKKKSEGKKDGKGDLKSCTECNKQYRTNYKLAEHMRKHTGEKPYKCSMCEKAFRSRIGLAQHEAKHTGHYDYNCLTCGKGFQCKSYLIVHQRVHSDVKPYPCETCGRNFKTKQSLLDHQNRHLGVKPYLCETCGRGFITKGLCKSHQKVHSGMDNRQYPCTVCHKLFVSKSYLTTHLRIHTGEKPFMCEVCGKGFLTRVDLRIHSTMHTGEKSFVCEICGKAFARRDALRCHKRSHTGERPYKCDICGQGFTQFSPMAIHKRLHTGERPYSCDICLKGFVSRSTMMSHRKKHTI